MAAVQLAQNKRARAGFLVSWFIIVARTPTFRRGGGAMPPSYSISLTLPASVLFCRSLMPLRSCLSFSRQHSDSQKHSYSFSYYNFSFLFPNILYIWMEALLLVLFLLLPNGVLLCDHRLDFLDRLMGKLIQTQSIMQGRRRCESEDLTRCARFWLVFNKKSQNNK